MKQLPPGRIMVDVDGVELSERDRRRLEHPACAGVILFSRNYESTAQLRTLCEQIKAVREPALVIGVDQEGGRVQRFRDDFTTIPPMRAFGSLWDRDKQQAAVAAHDAAYVIGTELAACGIDFSFAPVLDLDHGCSEVIGDRAFHASAEAVIELASAFIQGLDECGMTAVGKHFPGHGSVIADTHHETAVDHRMLVEIEREDLQPFVALCRGALGAVMPAHVVYDKLDARPASFSTFWLQDILRKRLGFNGAVLSDDLSMHAASIEGDAPTRAKAALAAGCDIALVCNAPDDADAVLQFVASAAAAPDPAYNLALQRRPRMARRNEADQNQRYHRALEQLANVASEAYRPIA
jgi:beta-N-acetylhexosaminidase